jgi:lipoate---protein ligase
MRCIALQTYDPCLYLATEEYLLKNSSEEYFILSIDAPSVIIGKHQSAHREINTKFITENNIPVFRRITGGGTVFHDTGNLNFTFIRNCEAGRQVDFRKHTRPVIEFLSSSGVNASFESKNDLKINGLKISGNAEHIHKNRLIHHGTLLFSASLEMLKSSLRKDTSCYITRAVVSNPSSVSNLVDFLPSVKDIFQFRDSFMNYMIDHDRGAEYYFPDDAEKTAITVLATTKYSSWEWTWAYGPDYQFVKHFDYQGYSVNCRIDVKEGIIRTCSLEGNKLLEAMASKIIGTKHMVKDIEKLFLNQNISDIEIFNFF